MDITVKHPEHPWTQEYVILYTNQPATSLRWHTFFAVQDRLVRAQVLALYVELGHWAIGLGKPSLSSATG